jgi:uncharacterized LabA/DUF88 family protein
MTPEEERLLREGTLEEFMDVVQVVDKKFLLVAAQFGKVDHIRFMMDRRYWTEVFKWKTVNEAVVVAMEYGHTQIAKFLQNFNDVEIFKFAAELGGFDDVRYMVEKHSFDTIVVEEAMMIAMNHGHSRIVEFLWQFTELDEVRAGYYE